MVGVGFAGLRALPQQSDDTSSADSAAGSHDPAQYAPSAPTRAFDGAALPPSKRTYGGHPRESAVGGSGSFADSISIAEIPGVAGMLAAHPQRAISLSSRDCAAPITGGPSTLVRYKGQVAVLTIDRATRLVTIYDCATATKTLYVTGY